MAAKLTAITFAPYRTSEPQPDWDIVVQKPIKIIWLISRPNAAHASARSWLIAIHTADDRVFTLHPRAPPPGPSATGCIDVVFKPICSALNATSMQDYTTLINDTSFRAGRAVQPGTKVYDILAAIQDSGIRNYALNNEGRGLRFWLGLAIFVLQDQIKEPRNFDTIGQIAALQMRNSLAPAPTSTSARNLEPGLCVPSLISEKGCASWKMCIERNEMLSNEEAVFGVYV